jgi:hypothetical protein
MLSPSVLAAAAAVTLLATTLLVSPKGTLAEAAEDCGWFAAVSAIDKLCVSQGKQLLTSQASV